MMKMAMKSNNWRFIGLGLIILSACHPQSGFTDKSEANNMFVNGVKEGKWVEYLDSTGNSINDVKKASFYFLTVYEAGKFNGIVRHYDTNANLISETPYDTGVENGLEKWYYFNGMKRSIIPYLNNKKNGDAKYYYNNGQLSAEIIYKNGKIEVAKYYDRNGNEIKYPVSKNIL